MSKPDLLPGPPEPKPEMVQTSINFDQATLEWLDGVAEQANRSRSDALREILRNVREQQERRTA